MNWCLASPPLRRRGCGTVAAVGPSVSGVAVGDAVVALPRLVWDGVQAPSPLGRVYYMGRLPYSMGGLFKPEGEEGGDHPPPPFWKGGGHSTPRNNLPPGTLRGHMGAHYLVTTIVPSRRGGVHYLGGGNLLGGLLLFFWGVVFTPLSFPYKPGAAPRWSRPLRHHRRRFRARVPSSGRLMVTQAPS